MKLSDFDYKLPRELIAQEPTKPRDHSWLLILDRLSGKIEHKHFYDIIDYLDKGDVLVLNNSKVFPARLIGKKKETGGRVEVFLLKKVSSPPLNLPLRKGEKKSKSEIWQCLVGGLRGKIDLEIEFGRGLKAKISKNNNDGTWEVGFNKTGEQFMRIVEKVGRVPLPPYIKKKLSTSDKTHYQTVFAERVGSVAAPTAGFHFTPALLQKIKNKGVQIEYVTLHVGLGTFAPVKVDDITKHKMHAEFVEVKKDVAQRIIQAKKEKRRIIAVGTTSVRTLEGVLAPELRKPLSRITSYKLPVTTFIYPGYKFKMVDVMITNFHLPKSTLLMLVSAFACAEPSRSAGKKNIDTAYKEAIKKKYRFYSYGDAMLIH